MHESLVNTLELAAQLSLSKSDISSWRRAQNPSPGEIKHGAHGFDFRTSQGTIRMQFMVRPHSSTAVELSFAHSGSRDFRPMRTRSQYQGSVTNLADSLREKFTDLNRARDLVAAELLLDPNSVMHSSRVISAEKLNKADGTGKGYLVFLKGPTDDSKFKIVLEKEDNKVYLKVDAKDQHFEIQGASDPENRAVNAFKIAKDLAAK